MSCELKNWKWKKERIRAVSISTSRWAEEAEEANGITSRDSLRSALSYQPWVDLQCWALTRRFIGSLLNHRSFVKSIFFVRVNIVRAQNKPINYRERSRSNHRLSHDEAIRAAAEKFMRRSQGELISHFIICLEDLETQKRGVSCEVKSKH
jgi:hypothetical protein